MKCSGCRSGAEPTLRLTPTSCTPCSGRARARTKREHGGALLHEGGHYLLRRARHTHADVIQLTLCLAAPWATVRAAVRAGALAPEALMLRQRFAPQWLLEWRCEVIARAFNSFEVA